jgi:short-subunit dehydrogenase
MGQAIAKAFAERGLDPVLVSRDTEKLASLKGELEQLGATVHRYQADATDDESIRSSFRRIEEELGTPEVLVYNPAIIAEEQPSELTPRGLQPFFDLMLYGAIRSVNGVLPGMRRRGSGTVLLTGGGFGIDPSAALSSHSIAKAALRNYAHALYKELEPEGIHAATVTITRPVEPGEDMEQAARQFVALHEQKAGEFDWEVVYGD